MKKNENKIVLEFNQKQYETLVNCLMDGMVYNQEKGFYSHNELMKSKYNVTYEKYFEIYSLIRRNKLTK